MKKYIKLFIGIFISFSVSTNLFSQSLTLVGDAKLSLNGEGVIFTAPSIKLLDRSQIIEAERVKLGQSEFIQLLSSEALLKTRILKNGEKAIIQVGIGSKTAIVLVNRATSGAFSIGMENLNEEEALPFFWKIESLNQAATDSDLDLHFSWDKYSEPKDFELKSLMRKEDSEWLMDYAQEIQDTTVTLKNFAFGETRAAAFTISTNKLDSDGDGVPDIIEIREGTDPQDPADYLDTDGDKVPDYIESIQNTNPLNPISYLDSNEDGVPDYVRDRSPIMFINISDLQIPWGYMNIDSVLPDSLVAVLGTGKIIGLEVNWDKSKLNIFKRGVYTILGDFKLYPGLFDAYELHSNIQVEVMPKPAPQNILLNNNSFEAEAGKTFIAVGDITVLDPIDNQHEISLADLAFDNVYFQINNGTLFWSSDERADGRKEFKVLVRVLDRDGNILEKEFTIIRNRTTVSNIEIFNTFTPDGDNVNDTWGVEELRFYTGTRIQIFERSGKRVFYTEDPDVLWDGKYNNVDMPIGTYYWTVEVGETREIRKGMLNLLRN